MVLRIGFGAVCPSPHMAVCWIVSPSSSKSSISPSCPFPLVIRWRISEHPLRSDTACDAFAAGLVLDKIHEKARRIDHASVFVHSDQSRPEPMIAPIFVNDS